MSEYSTGESNWATSSTSTRLCSSGTNAVSLFGRSTIGFRGEAHVRLPVEDRDIEDAGLDQVTEEVAATAEFGDEAALGLNSAIRAAALLISVKCTGMPSDGVVVPTASGPEDHEDELASALLSRPIPRATA